MEIGDQEKGLEFLDLTFKCVEGKLSVHVFPKPTNSFTYIKRSTCYPCKNANNVPRGIALSYAEYVTLMISLNLVLMNMRNI